MKSLQFVIYLSFIINFLTFSGKKLISLSNMYIYTWQLEYSSFHIYKTSQEICKQFTLCCASCSRCTWRISPNTLHHLHKNDNTVQFPYDMIIFSCDQAALWMVQSVRPSVRHTFLTMFPSLYHHEIFRSYYQWQKWRPCKKSRSEVKGQGHRGKKNRRIWPRLGVSGL